LNKELGGNAPNSDSIFENLNNSKKQVDENHRDILDVVDKVFDRIEKIVSPIFNEYFNEEEAARFLKLSDPSGSGKQTIRNYALRSKKIPFAKIGRGGLLFHKQDLDKLFQLLKTETFRGL
jgi:hypothetical protein